MAASTHTNCALRVLLAIEFLMLMAMHGVISLKVTVVSDWLGIRRLLQISFEGSMFLVFHSLLKVCAVWTKHCSCEISHSWGRSVWLLEIMCSAGQAVSH